MKRIANIGLGLTLFVGFLAVPAGAQDETPANPKPPAAPGPSLGDYARQVRKDGAPKAKPKIFDNDNLPLEDKLSVVGQAQPIPPAISGTDKLETNPAPVSAAGEKSATDNRGADNKPATDVKATGTPGKPNDDEAARQAAWKQWQSKLSAQREQVDLMTRELDVLQREYQIRAAAFYADAGNRLRNSGNWDKEDTQYKQQIADKQKALDDAKQKLDDIEEEARKAGVPASVREP
jgi:hypothetical protein